MVRDWIVAQSEKKTTKEIWNNVEQLKKNLFFPDLSNRLENTEQM